MKNVLIICAIVFGLSACEKSSGEGGTSLIEGQVYKIFTYQNSSTGLIDTSYFQLDPGKDVFLIYSNDEGDTYDDKFETDHNGRYRFEYLRKGDYTIYTYADSTELVGLLEVKYDYPIFKHIKIKENNSINIIPEFVIERNQ